MGLFSRMACHEFPTQLDPCYLVIEIEIDPRETGDTYPVEVRLIDEDGGVLTAWNSDLELPPNYEPTTVRTFTILRLPWDDRFVFQRGGMYRFDVVLFPNTDREDVLGGETLFVHHGPPRP